MKRGISLGRLQRLRLWAATHKRTVILGGILMLSIVVAFQVGYPSNHALPMARIDDKMVGGKSDTELAAQLQTMFMNATVTLSADKMSKTIRVAEAGAVPNTDRMVASLSNYPLWQRLIPFSIVMAKPEVTQLEVYFDQKKLNAVAADLAKYLSTDPKDAALAIEEGKLVATMSQPGQVISAPQVARILAAEHFSLTQTKLVVQGKVVQPATSDADMGAVRVQAQGAIARKIVLTGPNATTFSPDAATIASWLVIKNDAGKIGLAVNRDEVAKYVAGINDKVKVDPGVTQVTYLDGQEQGRNDGSQGYEVASDTLIDQLQAVVLDAKTSGDIAIGLRPVNSAVVNNRRYSSTQKGLQAYVDYVTSIQDVNISLVQLDGGRWTANGRADESIPSASTFKLYVAMVLFDKMEKGEIHWDDSMLDTNVAGCFERMTVASTNPCAEKWIANFGRQYIDDYIHARGMSGGSTFVTNGTAIRTTAGDLTRAMIALRDGTLYKGAYRDRLLDSLSRHPYRYAVPMGSAGKVWDKVGFLWDYVHDTAIVEHPKGTYVVSVMTRGQSYGRIAQITRELESIMYP